MHAGAHCEEEQVVAVQQPSVFSFTAKPQLISLAEAAVVVVSLLKRKKLVYRRLNHTEDIVCKVVESSSMIDLLNMQRQSSIKLRSERGK